MTGKLKYPDFLSKIPYRIIVYANGIDANTGERIKALEWRGNCLYSEKSENVSDKNRSGIIIKGRAIIEGDIAPRLASFAGGKFTVAPNSAKEITMTVLESRRPRNPDGSIHHISLELI